MEPERERAYRTILAAAVLHVKWDLGCWYGGFQWLLPWRARHQTRAARRAAFRSATFHNLAIFATQDFVGFSEDQFWREVEEFRSDFPETNVYDYRKMFERIVNGEDVWIINPSG